MDSKVYKLIQFFAHQRCYTSVKHSRPVISSPMSSNYVLKLVQHGLLKDSRVRILQVLTDTTLCKNIHGSIPKRTAVMLQKTWCQKATLVHFQFTRESE